MGVKKSTVCTSARSFVKRYTPASSALTEPTSTFGSRNFGSCRKTCDRAFWLNFDAHPAQDESDVSLRICSRDMRSPPFGKWLRFDLVFDRYFRFHARLLYLLYAMHTRRRCRALRLFPRMRESQSALR